MTVRKLTGHRMNPCTKSRSAHGSLHRTCEHGRIIGQLSSSKHTGHCNSPTRYSSIPGFLQLYTQDATTDTVFHKGTMSFHLLKHQKHCGNRNQQLKTAFMARSHHPHGQDKTVLSCLVSSVN